MKWSRVGLKRRVQSIVLGSPTQKDAVPVPVYGWKRVFLVIRQFYLRIIGLNLLFIICSLPVVTIPAAAYAMTDVSSRWVRDLPCNTVKNFFSAFRNAFFCPWLLGIALIILPFSLALYPMMWKNSTLATAVFVILAVLVFLLSAYWYPLLVTIDLPPLTNLKNALILMACEWRITLQILGSVGVAYALLFLLPEYAIPLFIVALFALGQVVACSLANEAITKHCVATQDDSNHI